VEGRVLGLRHCLWFFAALSWSGAADALSCVERPTFRVVPGSFDEVAPRNTHVFVDHTAFFDGKGLKNITRIELVEREGGREVATRILHDARRRSDQPHRGARSYIELVPQALLEADRRYSVIAHYDGGQREIATFATGAAIDSEPPRVGRVVHAEESLSRRARSVKLELDAAFDDYSSDHSLRLLIGEQGTAPGAAGFSFPLASAAHGRLRFDLAADVGDDSCAENNFDLPRELAGKRLLLALVDAAGNVSEPQPVTFSHETRPLRAIKLRSGLYHLPGVGLFTERSLILVSTVLGTLLGGASILLARRWLRRRRAA
jgi:hypothetical protein